MPLFSEESKKIAGESIFTHIELEKLFKNEQEQKTFLEVQKVLKETANTNQATKKLIEMGQDSVKILVKIGKYALTA